MENQENVDLLEIQQMVVNNAVLFYDRAHHRRTDELFRYQDV